MPQATHRAHAGVTAREIDRVDRHRFHTYWARLAQELPRTTAMLEEAFGTDLASAPFEL